MKNIESREKKEEKKKRVCVIFQQQKEWISKILMIMVDLARNHEGESGHNATREDATVVTELHRHLIFTFFTFFLYFLSSLSFFTFFLYFLSLLSFFTFFLYFLSLLSFFTFFLSCGIRLAGNKTHVKIMRPEKMQLFLLGHHSCIGDLIFTFLYFHFHKSNME